MKKIYINPTTTVVAVKTQKHILIFSEETNGNINAGGSQGIFDDATMEQASRKSSSWDDEE